MQNKIYVLILTLLIITSGFIIVTNDFEVKATPGGGGGSEEDDIGLDFDWMWNDAITTICSAVYEAYEGDKIIRGREMGTEGDRWTADRIEDFMNYDCGLENVKPIQIKPIKNLKCWNRYYTTRMNVIDYLLHIDIVSENYDHDIPVNESFVIPMTRPKDRLIGSLTFNFTLPNEDDIVIHLDLGTEWPFKWPFSGTLTNYSCKNLSIKPLNESFDILIGNATYVGLGDPLPDDQEDRVLIFDEIDANCTERLENVTNASGVLLIHPSKGDFQINESVTHNYSICRVETSEINLTDILDGLDNEPMIVDNVIDNNTLTFTYNLSEACLPFPDYVILSQRPMSGKLSFWMYLFYVLNRVNDLWDGADCKGIITYKTSENCDQETRSHEMNKAKIGRPFKGWFRDDNIKSDGEYKLIRIVPWPSLPIFFVNYSVGNCLFENRSEALVSGYEDQEIIKETHIGGDWTAGVEAYNVVGNLTIDQSGNPPNPDDPTILISNRYDGWWSEAAFDSGCGAGVVLAIAKYFEDYDIIPKVNITFLETTGEEYLFRGAQHYSDSNPNMNFSHWIGFDQLAGNWTGTALELTYNDENIRAIGENISKEHGYPKRTDNGYEDFHNVTFDFTGAEEDVWKERHKNPVNGGINGPPCKTICFSKNSNPFRHRRGEIKDEKFTAGDLMKNIDREDLNDTLELAWNITKYFTVNPDCWFNDAGWNYTISDSEDECGYNDTIFVEFDVKSTLPHDKVMINFSLETAEEEPYETVMYKVMNSTVNRNWTTLNVSFTLDENETEGLYRLKYELYNSTGCIDEIIDPDGPGESENINVTEYSNKTFLTPYNYCGNPPVLSNISATPGTVGFGFNVTISADVTSNVSDIDLVWVILIDPDFTIHNFTMSNIGGDTYEYVFNDTWIYGEHKFKVWAIDSNGNISFSPQHTFNVSAMASISVCTIKDSYGAGEIVNLTDPPGDGGSSQDIGYEFLDDNSVLRIWNKYDSYYFNTSNGIQFTNHKDEYWSHNVLMLGYYDNDEWNLIYRTDELSGFTKEIDSDYETYVNATLWKDLNYGGYDFRLAIRYHLGVDDNELTVIPYIKNIDDEDIPYVLGFGWEIKDIQVDMTPDNDYIEIDGTWYYLNGTIDETYTDLDQPCYYIREDKSENTFESLYLKWDEDLNYKVLVESRDGQYNAPVTLGIKIGTLDVGQEKQTSLFWHDASEVVYYFDDYDPGEAWTTNPEYMVDGNENTYASEGISCTVELCNNNTCNGSYLGIISKMELRVKGYYTGMSTDIILRPVINGIYDGNDYTFDAPPDSGAWSEWFDIPPMLASGWSWSDVEGLDCDVEAYYMISNMSTLYSSKVELRITYTSNFAPVVSNPYPTNGSTGIPLTPMLNITVYDADGDLMNITWYSNSSGSWVEFGSNSSVSDGTYHQTMVNASVNGQWWYWYVNVSDGTCYTVSDVFSFYTGNESKIDNTGSTNFTGYLWMQIEFYNETLEEWVVDLSVVDEKTPRVINSSEQLALDTIFNAEKVNTSLLSNGNGTYRVYAAFCDPVRNVLLVEVDDSSQTQTAPETMYLEAWYEFIVTYD